MQLLILSHTLWFLYPLTGGSCDKVILRAFGLSNESEKHNSMQVCWRS